MTDPLISLVVLTHDNLALSQACVDSLRRHTDARYELIIVDNGSKPEAASWAATAGDKAVLSPTNLGFSAGMNRGLAVAEGEYVAFINNDTVFPEKWASIVLGTLRRFPKAGIVAPAVTAAGNPATVRSEPGGEPIVFEPFGHLPSGVVYVTPTAIARDLGGWNEEYHIATGEDLDLLFTMWCNGLEVVLEPRVLVDHVSEASRKNLPGMRQIELANLEQFIDRWKRSDPPPPRIPSCTEELLAANLRHAAAAATWLERVVEARRTDSGSPVDANRVAELDRQIARLRSRLEAEEAKAARLMGRRSVRAALQAARVASPILRLARRRHHVGPQPEPGTSQASEFGMSEQRVSEQICRMRPSPGPTEGPLVSMVVLNRNGEEHLERLLRGLADNTIYRSFELIVVDNGSTDGSRELLRREWGLPTRVIANQENVTFSAGCNQGLAAASGPYTLLLNNDISPINPGWLGAMVEALETDNELGAAGALLIYPTRPGHRSLDPKTGADLTVQHRGVHFRWRRTDDPGGVVPWGYNMGVGEDPTDLDLVATVDVPAATAACMLVRTELLRQLGGLDEGYVYGVEDVELCLRIGRSGYRIAVIGNAALHHHEFGTQSKTEAERKRVSGLANLQHFAETWGPALSRMMDLEALEAGSQRLRHRERPRTVIVIDNEVSMEAGNAAHTLEAEMRAAGRHVMLTDSSEPPSFEDLSLVISASPYLDVGGLPNDVLCVAWVSDRFDMWLDSEWFRRYRVHVPANREIAERLTMMGTATTSVIGGADVEGMEEEIRRFLERPRLAIRVDDDASIRTGNEIATSIVRAGARCLLQHRASWDLPASQCVDGVLMLSNRALPTPLPSHVNLLWNRQRDTIGTSDPAYTIVTTPSTTEAAAAMVEILTNLPAVGDRPANS